ncbi:MAG: acyl-CoA/acyl-ACP dehydrogenase [Pseudomonadales bacterium]|nr:acyl-CoA/acyl-ACP dehydrogenase [Pseudomonadales bacterium]MCP5331979.1 acyl-CoA/acyl-ACP dehydrogenase [Pseudomonadales bacterium]
MDFTLSQEHQLIVDSADKIAQKFDRKYWLECAKHKRFPQEMWNELGSMGYLGITCPEEYGGAGMGMTELALLQERLASHGVALLYFVVNQGIAMPCISKHGTPEQKQRWLPAMARGEKRCCFAITEPNAGTNTFKIQTLGKLDGGDYVLNGSKLFISGINQADHVLVVARTQSYAEVGQDKKYEGLTLFVVDTKSPGLTFDPMDTMLQNTEGQYFVYFNNVRVPKENVIGQPGKGLAYLFDALNPERIVVAAGAVGGGRWCLKRGVEYANQRVIFDRPIGAYQGLQHPLADAAALLEVAWLMTLKAAWQQDNGENAGAAANIAKYTASEASYRAADAALQVHGGYGFTESMDMLHSFVGARLGKVAPINREMTLNYIGQHLLGLPKSY